MWSFLTGERKKKKLRWHSLKDKRHRVLPARVRRHGKRSTHTQQETVWDTTFEPLLRVYFYFLSQKNALYRFVAPQRYIYIYAVAVHRVQAGRIKACASSGWMPSSVSLTFRTYDMITVERSFLHHTTKQLVVKPIISEPKCRDSWHPHPIVDTDPKNGDPEVLQHVKPKGSFLGYLFTRRG